MAIDRVDTESVLMRTDQTRELGVHRDPTTHRWIQMYMHVVIVGGVGPETQRELDAPVVLNCDNVNSQ
jgi:hypothetical protein